MSLFEASADTAAYPHKTKDPIVLAAEIINAWQTIVSRENNPLDPIVITVGSIHGGTKHNIIPDEVKMQITVRTYKSKVRERVLADIDRIAKGCAAAAGIPAELAPIVSVPKDLVALAAYNNPELTKRLVAVWKKSLGDENVEIVDPTMGGDDFSEYSLPDYSIPAVYFHFGAVEPAKIAEFKEAGKELPTLHSSKFAPVPEPTIRTGMIGMTTAGAGSHEEVGQASFLRASEPCAKNRSGIPRDPSTALRFARDDIA